ATLRAFRSRRFLQRCTLQFFERGPRSRCRSFRGCMPGRRSRTEEVLVLRKTAVAIIPSVAAVLVMLGGPARSRTPNAGPRAARPAPRIEALREMMRESGRGDDRYREGRGYRDAFQAWFFSQRAYPGETVPRNALGRAVAAAQLRNRDM